MKSQSTENSEIVEKNRKEDRSKENSKTGIFHLKNAIKSEVNILNRTRARHLYHCMIF